MKELAILITEMVNQFHDAFISLCGMFGIHLTDKEMHFWVIGIFGIIFLASHTLCLHGFLNGA